MNRRFFIKLLCKSTCFFYFSPIIFKDRGFSSDSFVYYNFAGDIDHVNKIYGMTHIDFGDKKDARYLLSGWSYTEKGFTWSMGKMASIEFYTFHPEYDKKIEVFCRPFPPLGRQEMQLYLNNEKISSVTLDKKVKKYTFHLPQKHQKKYKNIIEFQFKACGRPIDYKTNQDKRCLSAQFHHIQFPDKFKKNQYRIRTSDNNSIVIPPDTAIQKFLYIEPKSILNFQTRSGIDTSQSQLSVHIDGLSDKKAIFDTQADPFNGVAQIDLSQYASKFADLTLKYTRKNLNSTPPFLHGKIYVSTTSKTIPNRPNILFVVIDTLRADRCSCYGFDDKVSTPNIDSLASRGVQFQNAFCHIPITLPSHVSMFTSRYPFETGVLYNGQTFSKSQKLLAQLTKTLGFQNCGIYSLETLSPFTKINKGIDSYKATHSKPFWFQRANETNHDLSNMVNALTQHENWFMFLHYADPHGPYHAHGTRKNILTFLLNDKKVAEKNISEESRVKLSLRIPKGESILCLKAEQPFSLRLLRIEDPNIFHTNANKDEGFIIDHSVEGTVNIKNLSYTKKAILYLLLSENPGIEALQESYAAEVEYVDNALGQAMGKLKENNLLQNTVILFTSDHGEGLGDHNHIPHGDQLYNTLIHVPLLLIYPPVLPQGRIIDTRVQHIDILPTLMNIMQCDFLKSWQGRSLLPVINGEETTDRDVLSMTFRDYAPNNLISLLKDNYKLIKNLDNSELELYNIKEDYQEIDNLKDKNFLTLNRMEHALDKIMAEKSFSVRQAQTNSGLENLDQEKIEMLRGLGYIK